MSGTEQVGLLSAPGASGPPQPWNIDLTYSVNALKAVSGLRVVPYNLVILKFHNLLILDCRAGHDLLVKSTNNY